MIIGTEIIITESIGIIAFAVSGALVAVKKNFDIFGTIVLGVMTAVGGGALRDIILGVLPPTMFLKPHYVLLAFVVSTVTFFVVSWADTAGKKDQILMLDAVNFFDAIGLGVFAVTGTNAAIMNGYGDNAFLSIFVGTITGIGGGMIRDVLAGKVPFVLYKDIYASASIIGACVFYFLYTNNVNETLSVFGAIIITIGIRLFASVFKLRLPRFSDIRIKPKHK